MSMNGMFDEKAKPVTVEEMIACVRRELALRKNVYPKWVAAGRMKQQSANNELRVLQGPTTFYRHCDGRAWILLREMERGYCFGAEISPTGR